ncbi:hypothetical protein ANCCAN_17740 [Ancylostoma caninum]|uniref:N-acetylgalactosaminide beta-1,3-galactosyltransferase n=1 Tax=Ancylostoma caninum TaxID=29170 RepID=A0A368FW29_ANCCA|nr:hypothetical protein ANCCAN_17740 [Ancylostoma caninum]
MGPFTRQCVRAIKYLQSLLHWIVTGPIFCVLLGIFVGWHVSAIISNQIEFGSEPKQSSDTVRIHENITNTLENETERVFPFEDNEHRNERIIADFVASKVRVFCWIATEESRHRTNAKAVKSTWAQRCNKHLFVSTRPDKALPAIDLGITNKKRSSWQKTRAMLQLIQDHFIDRYDWFLAAQDDSYVILENLRIVTDGLVNSPSCYGDSAKNEAEATMGCFQESRVRFVDTRDRNNAHS